MGRIREHWIADGAGRKIDSESTCACARVDVKDASRPVTTFLYCQTDVVSGNCRQSDRCCLSRRLAVAGKAAVIDVALT